MVDPEYTIVVYLYDHDRTPYRSINEAPAGQPFAPRTGAAEPLGTAVGP
jgi:hypothetical protein